MPTVVQRVAVVSSAQAAGYQDFCKELAKSPYRFEVELFDAFMQGEAAEGSIIDALCRVADRLEEFDAVVIIRGGGSRSDLNCFNAYRICSYVAQFPLPVITGIGHDKDTSVADMVAHTALKTPTAVAGWLVERMDRICGWLDAAALQLHDGVLRLSRTQQVRLEELAGDVRHLSLGLLRQRGLELGSREEVFRQAVGSFLRQQRQQLAATGELVESRSPRHILRMGFAVVRSGGRAVTSVRQVAAGERLSINVADGRFSAEVKAEKRSEK